MRSTVDYDNKIKFSPNMFFVSHKSLHIQVNAPLEKEEEEDE